MFYSNIVEQSVQMASLHHSAFSRTKEKVESMLNDSLTHGLSGVRH